jgi:hypothetical protein
MNVETKTAPLPETLHPMPPEADMPIRSTYLHEEALRELGARLAGGGPAIDPALDGLDFHARIDASNGYSTFTLGYEGEFGDQVERHSLNASVRFRF